jgi:hypothetical protein
MGEFRLHVQDSCGKSLPGFRTGLSLHSHTLHSRESLDFIYQAAQKNALLRAAIKRGEARYRASHGTDLDLTRGWWTPPLSPLDAFALEAKQLEEMSLQPIVSLTDHDDIEAPMSLQAIEASRKVPISVEWTVPYRETFFHLGVHNLIPGRARSMMGWLAKYTVTALKAPTQDIDLADLLEELDADPATLIVFNHPLWDEKGVGAEVHEAALMDLLRGCGRYIHALELNGLRPWSENRRVVDLAESVQKPLVSGGDRHIIEPNAIVNLSNAETFEEFAAEVREDCESNVMVLPHYHEAHASRIFHNMLDVFRTYDNHGRGWKSWADRVFYMYADGQVQSLTQIWGDQRPRAVSVFAGFMQFVGQPHMRRAVRFMTAQGRFAN